jgi:hypothetical protein
MGFLSDFSRERKTNDRPGSRQRARFVLDTPEPVREVPILPVERPEPVASIATPEVVIDAAEPSLEFDPSTHTVAEVLTYLRANPDDRARVIEAEQAGKARGTILAF